MLDSSNDYWQVVVKYWLKKVKELVLIKQLSHKKKIVMIVNNLSKYYSMSN